MKLSVSIAGAVLASVFLVSGTAQATSVVASVSETYDSSFDAAFLHVTNTTGNAFSSLTISGGFAGSSFSGPLAAGATADFLMGDNESNVSGSQGTALVTVVASGHTFSGSFTDVLGDPDFNVGSTPVGTLGSAVPEPASWAMMLTGFGLLGTALRTSRRNAVTA